MSGEQRRRAARRPRPAGVTSSAVDQIVHELQKSRRYRDIDAHVLRRFAAQSLDREGGRVAPATKRAKRALHGACGAFIRARPSYATLEREITAAAERDPARVQEVLRRAMAAHASTSERLPILEGFYSGIFERTGVPGVVLDIACGLNPLAAPWMSLPEGATYLGFDIDARLVSLARTALDSLGIRNRLWVADALDPVDARADVALLLKSAPCLESQGAAPWRLVDALDARAVVISFPTRSLGGRGTAMAATYTKRFETEASARAWSYETLHFAGEIAFVVWK